MAIRTELGRVKFYIDQHGYAGIETLDQDQLDFFLAKVNAALGAIPSGLIPDGSITAAKLADAYLLLSNLDTDSALAANSDAKAASQKAVKSFVTDFPYYNLNSIPHHDVRKDGADPTGAADSLTAINTTMARVAAQTNTGSVQASNQDVVFFAPGTYKLSDTLVLDRGCAYVMYGVYFTPGSGFPDNHPLVQFGSTSASMRVYRGRVYGGPHCYQSLNWTTGRIGVRIANCQEWKFDGLSVDGFPLGIELYGNAQGSQHNTIDLEKVTNCFCGMKDTLANSGWTNVITVRGGHFNYGSGDPSTSTLTTPNSRPIHVWARGATSWLFENTAFETINPRTAGWGATTDAFYVETSGLASAAISMLNCHWEVAPEGGSTGVSDYMAGTWASGTADCFVLGGSTGHLTVTDQGTATAARSNLDLHRLGLWNGSFGLKIQSISTTTALNNTHNSILASGNITLTLPDATLCNGRLYRIKKTDSGTTVTMATTSSQTIDGAAPGTLTTQWSSLIVQSDGANWIKWQ